MRRTRLIWLGVIALSLLFPLAAAHAAPRDVTRPSDGELRFCPEGKKCVARAVGDFNGDRMDDVLFERMVMNTASDPAFVASRQFDLHLSPFTLVPVAGEDVPERIASARVTFSVDSRQSLEPVSVADLNGDGRSDLLFNTIGVDSAGLQQAKVLVMLGRANWGRSYNLNNATSVDIRITPQVGIEQANQFALLTSGVADLNGDKKNDLVLSLDTTSNSQVRSSSGTRVVADSRQSQVMILLNKGTWPSVVNQTPDVFIANLGSCASGLAGTADVTGDGLADVIVRRCVAGLPTTLRVLPGRSTWPAQLTAEDSPNVPHPPTPEPGQPPSPRDPVQPPGGGGYLPSEPPLPMRMPEQFLLQDINGDGTTDMAIELNGKTHVWYGGPTVAARAIANRTSAVFLKAGYGALPLTHSWGMLDLNGDGKKDLLLSRPLDPSLLACPDGSCQRTGTSEKSSVGGRPVYVFGGATANRRVLDVEMDQADVMWNDPAAVIWGMGDFNADGNPDLLLGSPPGAFDSVYSMVFGPLTNSR